MKTRLLCMFVILLGFYVNAQDVTLSDFENQSFSPWDTWGAPLSIEENPLKTGNTSNYVTLLDQKDAPWSGMFQNINNGLMTTLGDYSSIKVDVFSKDSASTIKLYLQEPVSETTKADSAFEAYLNIEAGSWKTLEFDISSAKAIYKQIAFQSSTQDSIYFDNIVMIASQASSESDTIEFEDFEDGIGDWKAFSATATVSIASNPDNAGINTSASVAKFEQTEQWNGISLWEGDNTSFSDNIVAIIVDVYPVDSTLQNLQLFISDSKSGEANYTSNKSGIDANTWTTVSFSLTSMTVHDYQQFAFQTGNHGIVYFDNIKFVKASTTPVVEVAESAIVSIEVINVLGQTIATVTSLSEIPAGVSILKITKEDGSVELKKVGIVK